MKNDEPNPRQELLERFLKSLKQPVSERFFDEDELVELYDYANEMHDDYVQLEALLCGARLYPDSHMLAERRLMLYLDTTDDETDARTTAAKRFIDDNTGDNTLLSDSALTDIARMELMDGHLVPEAFEYFLNQHDKLSGEEVARLIDTVADKGLYSMLKEHYNDLEKRVTYLPALQFAMAREAENMSDNDFLIELAEKLIEQEPFAVTYWLFLLRGQARSGKEDEVYTTYDYAKALASDDPQAMLGIGETVFYHAPYLIKDMVKVFTDLAKQYPDDYNYTDALCSMLVSAGRHPEVTQILMDYLKKHPGESRPLQRLLTFARKGLKPYIEAYFEANPSPDIDLLQLCRDLSFQNSHQTVLDLTEEMQKRDIGGEFLVFLRMEAAFALHRYVVVIDTAESTTADFGQFPYTDPSLAMLYVLSLIKTGHFIDVDEFIKKRRSFFEDTLANGTLPSRCTARLFLNLVSRIEKYPLKESFNWDYFDPLGYGKF